MAWPLAVSPKWVVGVLGSDSLEVIKIFKTYQLLGLAGGKEAAGIEVLVGLITVMPS